MKQDVVQASLEYEHFGPEPNREEESLAEELRVKYADLKMTRPKS